MDRLPVHMLVSIGELLSRKDRVACTAASRMFHAVHASYKYHQLTLNDANVAIGLARLSKTARYVTELKPGLTELEIVFDSLTESSCSALIASSPPPPASFTTQLHFKNCEASAIDRVLDSFAWPSTELKVTSTQGLTGEERFLAADQPRAIASIVTVLDKHHIGILKNHRLCTCRKIKLVTRFDCDDGDVVVDLSHIDARANPCLTVSNFSGKGSVVNYVDAWKITRFVDQRRHYERGRRDNLGLALGLFRYAADEPREFRMHSVCIPGDFGAQHETLLDLAKTLPKHVEWNVSVRAPEDLAYLDELKKVGVGQIAYMCVDRETHLSARLSKKLLGREFDFNLNTVLLDAAEQKNTAELRSANDIYDAMSDDSKRRWFAFWKVAQRERDTI